MSEKAKIYAFCEAGCKWETVHRDEHEQTQTQLDELSQTVDTLESDITETVKSEAITQIQTELTASAETWTFTLESGETVNKNVVIM